MTKAMIICNPSAGKEKARDLLPRAISNLKEVYDEVYVRETKQEGDAVTFAHDACDQQYDAVISMGGDGTVSETINGLAEQHHRPVFGLIPLGTVNDFARALSIPLDPEEAASVLSSQRTKAADIGKINNRFFMNVLAVGAVAEATYNVSVKQKTLLGPLAYLIEGGKALVKKTPFKLTVNHDLGKWQGEAYLMVAALTNSVGGFNAVAPDAQINDGKIHVLIIKDLSLPNIMKIIPSLLWGELKKHDQVEYFQTSLLDVSSDEELAVNIDGDEGVPLPFRARILNQHLNVIVPK
ncbi:diacylglycerol kinase family lipid kinase [Peribacillus psychrosaccharolyticus]|uniref:Diacylglycerol kinase family lipid kinase n=1 Tax=Peribacillus psychrosaccharolyticus TaxID=1407 RepID=A0A974RYQ3_PERPY|nr:diacylglycerol kinase family protein [Peribacillus psychrosaccharolyticus]MEC2057876.1 diacylglycerol kinase family lipid kinase [Peribacillus psychrosaccharolyticus]MED3744567.1 diacylglycerol kinase family lipid kinase [Peribacillus psychrosaccharolyticus]QQS98688.1 diacylglycerol kinase family lipid kinase [Peribacillus psychrosaccharolyticus]